MDVANYAFWQAWDMWENALWMGIGSGVGSLLWYRILTKRPWKHAIIVAVLTTIITGLLILAVDHHRFMKIWEDVIINGNIS